MARTPIRLSDSELPVVAAERYSHPDQHVRRKMFVLWSVHAGITQAKAGKVAGVSRATLVALLLSIASFCLRSCLRRSDTNTHARLAAHPAEQARLRLFEHDDLRIILGHAELIERLVLGLVDGSSGGFHPFHGHYFRGCLLLGAGRVAWPEDGGFPVVRAGVGLFFGGGGA